MPRHPHEPVTPTLPMPPFPPAPPCGCMPPRMRPEPFSPGGLPAPHGFDFGRWAREKISWLLSLVPSAASADNQLADREWVEGQAVGGKADKVAGAAGGNLAALTQDGNLADSGKKPSDFATAAQGAKADTAVQPAAIAGFVDGAEYDAEYGDPPKPTILLKHGGEVVATVDATDFVIDGMVSNVKIENGNLVITFNTDSGKQPISIPLTDIFNPANYYTKTDVDGLLADKASKADATLNLRGPDHDGFSAWSYHWDNPHISGADAVWDYLDHPNEWIIIANGGEYFLPTGVSDSSALSLAAGIPDGGSITAARTALGYVLGPDNQTNPNYDKPLATAAQGAKADAALPAADVVAPSTSASDSGKAADAKATGDALAGKLDKSGGQVTGPLSAPQVNITREGYPTWSMELDSEVGRFHFKVPPLAGVLGSVDLVLPRRTDNISGTVALAASPSTAGNLAALDANGNPTDSTIPAAKVAVKGDLRYTLVTAPTSTSGTTQTVTLADRANSSATQASGVTTVALAFPAAVTGKARDFILALTCGATPPNVTFPAGVTIVVDDSTDLMAEEGLNLYSFTEISASTFVASRLLVTAYTAQ